MTTDQRFTLAYNEAVCPVQIEDRSIVIDGDSGAVIKQLL